MVAISGTILVEDTVNVLIADSHRLVESLLGGAGLDVDMLEAIERWYTAHLCWAVDTTLRIKTDHTGSGSYSLEGDERFLKQAIALDPTGKLQAHVNEQKFVPFLQAVKTTRTPAKVEVVGGNT